MGYVTRQIQGNIRRDVRFATTFRAALQCDDGQKSVIVSDISIGGALVKGRVLPAVGAKVRLVASALNAAGRVIWRLEGLAGISFDSPVAPLHVVRENIDYFGAYRRRRKSRAETDYGERSLVTFSHGN